MRRVISHVAMVSGCLMLILGGTLAFARRDDPLDWIIFSVQAGQYNSGKVDVYRVLADGTHTQKFISDVSEYPVIWPLASNPGWFTYYDTDLGGQRLKLVHLTGQTEEILNKPTDRFPSVYYYDRQHQRVYLTVTNDPVNNSTFWMVDLNTGEQTPYELPLKLNYIRHQLGDEGYVYWSDHASAGDLYAVRFADLPEITPLTTGGKVLAYPPFFRDDGWMYYYADDGDPDDYVNLYRLREDGSATHLIAKQVLIVEDAMGFNYSTADTICYWAGDPEQPHLVQARPDGSDPVDLPVAPIKGLAMGWSPDREWYYYTEQIIDPNASTALPSDGLEPTITGNLRRIHLQTGEDQFVWNGGRPYTLTWSADGQTLLVIAENSSGYGYMTLFAMQPDGSEARILYDNVRSSSLTQVADVDLVVLGTYGEVGSEMHILNLDTLEIHRLQEEAPPKLMRQVLTTLPMPDYEWQAGWLIGVGIVAIGAGVMAKRRH